MNIRIMFKDCSISIRQDIANLYTREHHKSYNEVLVAVDQFGAETEFENVHTVEVIV